MCWSLKITCDIRKTDAIPLARNDTLLDKLDQAEVFPTLGLANEHWHIPIYPEATINWHLQLCLAFMNSYIYYLD